MRRRTLNVLTAVCLLLAAAAVGSWIRSTTHVSGIARVSDHVQWSLAAERGRLIVWRSRHSRHLESRPEPAPPHWWSWEQPANAEGASNLDMTDASVRGSESRWWVVRSGSGILSLGNGVILDWWILPHWTAVTALLLLPTGRLVFVVRRALAAHRRRETGRCPTCGYDLRAIPARCPECGAVPSDPGPAE